MRQLNFLLKIDQKKYLLKNNIIYMNKYNFKLYVTVIKKKGIEFLNFLFIKILFKNIINDVSN